MERRRIKSEKSKLKSSQTRSVSALWRVPAETRTAVPPTTRVSAGVLQKINAWSILTCDLSKAKHVNQH
ncbi:uncharacterized [Tachysurus ichikawai]